jgi:hypothetical protein
MITPLSSVWFSYSGGYFGFFGENSVQVNKLETQITLYFLLRPGKKGLYLFFCDRIAQVLSDSILILP